MTRKLFIFALIISRMFWISARTCLNSVEDAIKIANNNDAQGQLQIRRAQEQVRMAKKSVEAFLPELDFTISDNAGANIASGDFKQKTIDIGITQKLFNGGKSVIEYKMNVEKSLYDFLDVRKNQEKKRKEIAKVYYNALLGKLKEIVLEDSVKNAIEILKFSEIQNLEGLISETDYLESQIRFRKMLAKKINAKNQSVDLLENLKDLMNLDRKEELTLNEAVIPDKINEEEMKSQKLKDLFLEINEESLKNSLDLKKARAQNAWLTNQNSLLKKALLPSLAVRTGISFSGRNYPIGEPLYSIKFILSFDKSPWLSLSGSQEMDYKNGGLHSIFDSISGKVKYDAKYLGQIRLNKIDIEQNRIQTEKLESMIKNQVRQLIQEIENLEEELVVNFETLKLKEKKIQLSKIQIEEGAITKSSYLEELNDYAMDKINYLETMLKRKVLIMELEDLSKSKF